MSKKKKAFLEGVRRQAEYRMGCKGEDPEVVAEAKALILYVNRRFKSPVPKKDSARL